MRQTFDASVLPSNASLFSCSSHEERCLGIARNRGGWKPEQVVLFHYDDDNPRRERNHEELRRALGDCPQIVELPICERDIADSFRQSRTSLSVAMKEAEQRSVVVDVSVLTKRHLLLLLRWLDDHGFWDRLWIVYTEPEEYEIDGHLPLSFGISRIEQIAGFSASPDASRPLHVAMFLGYEGDRAFATYELLQPRKTTLIIPDPPFRAEWRGRTEQQNHNLLSLVEGASVVKADSLDPDDSLTTLERTLGLPTVRSEFARAICPLGTKPQIVGAYKYLRLATDPPAVIYTGALRHNHSFYSRGVGTSWLIHKPS